jgi:hypothetical protein
MNYCPRCLRTEAELDACPNEDFPGMKCPDPVAEDPTKDITIACGPCDFTRVVPVRELISGKAKNKLPACRRDDCACVVVAPEKAPVDPVMPELRDDGALVYDALKPGHIEAFLSDDPVAPLTEEPTPVTPETETIEMPDQAPPVVVSKKGKAKATPPTTPE